jgi:hypothetical protein
MLQLILLQILDQRKGLPRKDDFTPRRSKLHFVKHYSLFLHYFPTTFSSFFPSSPIAETPLFSNISPFFSIAETPLFNNIFPFSPLLKHHFPTTFFSFFPSSPLPKHHCSAIFHPFSPLPKNH